jgi:hypothetical protein
LLAHDNLNCKVKAMSAEYLIQTYGYVALLPGVIVSMLRGKE